MKAGFSDEAVPQEKQSVNRRECGFASWSLPNAKAGEDAQRQRDADDCWAGDPKVLTRL